MNNQILYGDVTTSTIFNDGTYEIIVSGNNSEVEYRKCTYVQQPGINTFPKVGDTVLLLIVEQGQYAILGIVSYYAKTGIVIENKDIKIKGTTKVIGDTNITGATNVVGNTNITGATNIAGSTNITGNAIAFVGNTITANGEDLTTDNT